jgi:hypothetical protein
VAAWVAFIHFLLFGQMIPGPGGNTTLTPANTPFITSQSLGAAISTFTGCIGFQFTVGASNITVTDLGRWVIAGNSASHVLTLQNIDGTPVSSVSVNTSGAPTAQYLYGSVTPAVLTSGVSYWLGSAEVTSTDEFSDLTTVTVNSAATLDGYTYNVSGCPNNPVAPIAGAVYVPVNFKYHL